MTLFDRFGGFVIGFVLMATLGTLALVTAGNPTPLVGLLTGTALIGPGWWWMHHPVG